MSNEIYLSELAKVKRAPVFGDLEGGSTRDTLAGFLLNDFIPHLDQAITDSNNFGKCETQILAIIGNPGVGKTRIRINTEGTILLSSGHEKLGSRSRRITWESHGEWAARQSGLITTNIQKPYTLSELADSNREIEQTTYNTLTLEEKPVFISLEVPGTTSTMANGTERGRPLGFNLLYQLARKEGPFKNLDYRLNIVGLTGGPILREVMVYFRDALNNPNIDFQKAAELAYLSGQIKKPETHLNARNVPKEEYLKRFTIEDWRALKNGASVEQIELIEQTTRDLAKFWIDQGRMSLPSSRLFKHVYPWQLSGLFPDRDVSNNASERWAIDGALMRHIVGDEEQLASQQFYLGYYDPIIIFPDLSRLAQELTDIEKNIEERKRAF